MLIIEGKKPLYGEVTVQGAKNSILPLLSAAILCKGESVIHNCPYLTDVYVAVKILKHLGCKVEWQGNTVTVNSECITRSDIPNELMREMRSSVVFLGSLLARTGYAEISLPGGCSIGERPVNLHIDAVKSLGASCIENDIYMNFSLDKRFIGTDIRLDIPSVGATENILLACTTAVGNTRIINCAREPEVQDLANFLNKCGARITGIGSSCMYVEGVEQLYGCEYSVISDRIAAVTYLCGTASAGGDVTLNNVNTQHIKLITDILSEMGCYIEIYNQSVRIKVDNRLKSPRVIKTGAYPDFPTDAQALLMAVSCICEGKSVFIENIFENRFKHTSELIKMGADISISNNIAYINGIDNLKGTKELYAKDLRGGAAIVIASLGAEGISEINGVNYIDRGYDNIEGVLSLLGAEVRRL